jgi:hypothetical protein
VGAVRQLDAGRTGPLRAGGRRHLAAAHRWQWVAIALGIAAALVNTHLE